MLFTAAALLLAPLLAPPAPAQITFTFHNSKLQPSDYTIQISEDGSGHYKSVAYPFQPVDESQDVVPESLERPIKIADPILASLFRAARANQFFAMECEASGGHSAFTGQKTLRYQGPDGRGICIFNYSHNKQINQLATQFLGIAFTLEEGRRLSVEHLHDRLALDAELEALQNAAHDGSALELQNIAPELASIATDQDVMARARKRAESLLGAGASK
jgi:hypothetical protein